MSKALTLTVIGWFALWLTEVIVAKVRTDEPVPFPFYGAQSLLVALFFYVLFS